MPVDERLTAKNKEAAVSSLLVFRMCVKWTRMCVNGVNELNRVTVH